jgi:hypothetical protein
MGYIKNVYNSYVIETYSKADKFLIHLPTDATDDDKLLIVLPHC